MSIWSMYGTSDFPLTQPMVGQKEFYDIFRTFTRNMKTAGLATIFPLISKWGVGKSRIGFELVSEPLGMDKGWIINEDAERKQVRIFKPNFEDGVLPLYIRYSQMYHEDLLGDNWVAYGVFTALRILSLASDSSIQGKIMASIQNALAPMGFDNAKLKELLQIETMDLGSLVIDSRKLDELTRKGLDYLKKFGIDHVLIVCDELETEAEIAKYGIEKDKELISKIDGESIQVITSAIKHEDPRKKYPDASFLLLCSTVIGGSIQGIGALDRRTEMFEMHQNSFADISDFISYLKDKSMVPSYPAGMVEAAYAIAGGNFGWFNVIMANVDDQLSSGSSSDTGFVFENILKSSSRFQTSLIDKACFEYIQCDNRFKQDIKHALLSQIPIKGNLYSQEQVKAMLEAKAEDGEKLFKEFYCVKILKEDLASFMVKQGYKRESGDLFVNSFGGKFDLEVLLKSLKTFSINVKEHEFIVGKEEETFLDQIRMLYPMEDIEESARYVYQYILEKAVENENDGSLHLGPNFSYLSRLDKRYRVEKDDFGYVPDATKNKEIEKLIQEKAKNKKEEVKRVLSGICRALEITYPEEFFYSINNVDCVRTYVTGGPYLDVQNDRIVDVVWGKDEEKIKEVLINNKFFQDNGRSIGAHPVLVVSDSIFSPELTTKFVNDKYEGIGKCLVFVTITRLQKDVLEAMSLPKDVLDIRENINQITTTFRDRIRKIRDHFNENARKWFDKLDEEGWILRPIVYKKSESSQIELLSKAYKSMLICNIDFEELGTKKDMKISDGEYTDLKAILKNTFIGKIDESKGYRETGLFEKESYSICIPSCINKIVKFNEHRKSIINYEEKFFFSGIKDVKPKKIVEHWIYFLSGLNLLSRTKDGFIDRISLSMLNDKYDLVKSWLYVDCPQEIENMRKVIDGDYLNAFKNLQIPVYKSKLIEAKEYKDKVKIEILENRDDRNYDYLREVVTNIQFFKNLCFEVYDREGWNNIKTYSPNIIKDIKINDNDKPLWYRVRHIRLFIEYISNLKDAAVKAIQEKVVEIKNNSEYQGFVMPLSPVTNILQRYCNELEYSTNFKKLEASTLSTMVQIISTLAYKLQAGDYNGAYARIEEILDKCGFSVDDENRLTWSNENGVMGTYKKVFTEFCTIIDGYKGLGGPRKWIKYFDDATENLRNHVQVTNLKKYVRELEFFIDGGLNEAIDDKEPQLLNKPEEFLELLKNIIAEKTQYVGEGLIKGYTENVKNIAREEKNKLYDEGIITSLDKIRKTQAKTPVSASIDRQVYPTETKFNETKIFIETKMIELTKEGESFFNNSTKVNKVTFAFFKDVVAKNAEIDWNEFLEEKKELEILGLIRTKVEVV